MKHTALFILFFAFVFSSQAFALDHWYLPLESQLKVLVIENSSNQSQDMWISGPINQPTTEPEVYYDIPARAQVEVPLDEFQEFPWIHIKAKDNSTIRLKVTNKEKTLVELEHGNSNRWTSSSLTKKDGKLYLLNTSAVSQSVSVSLNKQSTKYTMAAFSKLHLSVKKGNFVDIQSDQRITALLQIDQKWQYLTESSKANALKVNKDPRAAYFLFSNGSQTQSFIMKTDNEELKEQARNQIAAPQKYPKRILVGTVGTGHGNINRDWFHKNKSPWAWHMANAVTFTDLASQECDGSPEFVDEFIFTWAKRPGTICFWSYKVSKELTLEQIEQGKP